MSYEITDEQIADLECRMDTAEQGYGESAYISNETCRSLISRLRAAEMDAVRYHRALQAIIDIELQEFGADWEEIEEAQEIAESAMKGEQQ